MQKSLLFILITTLYLTPLFAQENSPDKKLYLSGVKSYQNKNTQEAFESFKSSLKLNPNNEYVLYNFGLTALDLKKPGIALGAWRRAMHLSPGFPPATKALAHVLKANNGSLDTSFWSDYRKNILGHFTLTSALLFQALLLFIVGYSLINYFSQQKKALEEDLELPSLSKISYIFIFLLVLVNINFFAKLYDSSLLRGTVITASQPLYSTPDPQSSVLVQLNEGDEVIIKRSENKWHMIKYPNGLMGWVPDNTIFKSSGKNIW